MRSDRGFGGLVRRRLLLAGTFAVLAAGVALPAHAGAVASILDTHAGLPDVDVRTGKVAPSSAQRQIAASLTPTT